MEAQTTKRLGHQAQNSTLCLQVGQDSILCQTTELRGQMQATVATTAAYRSSSTDPPSKIIILRATTKRISICRRRARPLSLRTSTTVEVMSQRLQQPHLDRLTEHRGSQITIRRLLPPLKAKVPQRLLTPTFWGRLKMDSIRAVARPWTISFVWLTTMAASCPTKEEMVLKNRKAKRVRTAMHSSETLRRTASVRITTSRMQHRVAARQLLKWPKMQRIAPLVTMLSVSRNSLLLAKRSKIFAFDFVNDSH